MDEMEAILEQRISQRAIQPRTTSEASHRLDSALGFLEQVLSPNTIQVMERSAEPKIYIGWANVTWVFIISLVVILTSLMAVSLSRGASNTII